MKVQLRFISTVLIVMVFLALCGCGSGGGGFSDPAVNPSAPTSNVTGTVTANNVGLAGVTITLLGKGFAYTGTTDSNGNYTITKVRYGTYIVSPSLPGYTFPQEDQTIQVNSASSTINDFTAKTAQPAMVYVIAKSAGSVICINANTLAIEKTINLGVQSINSIAVMGNYLWYSWGDQWGYIGRYNLTTDQNETQVIGNIYEGLLRTSPAQPGILYVGFQGLSPASIRKFDISVNPPALLSEIDDVGSNLGDFKISTDGSKIWSACGAPYNIAELRTSDMLLSGTTFSTGAYPTAVDRTTVNGTEILVGGTNSIYDTDVHVFQASDPSISVSYDTGMWSADGNVAISKSATKIYIVNTKDYNGSVGELMTIFRPLGTVIRRSVTSSTTFNSGIGVDYLSGRVFVASFNSVSVFDSLGNSVGVIPSIAGASTILVVAP